VGVWVSLLRVPYRLLYPSIIVFCCIGSPPVQPEPLHAQWPSSDEPRVSR
jgi:putative tricarboxylic transport membrane protein